MNIYTENGFKDRHEYLTELGDNYGMDMDTLEVLADLLGEEEDFDGLLTSIEDFWQEGI